MTKGGETVRTASADLLGESGWAFLLGRAGALAFSSVPLVQLQKSVTHEIWASADLLGASGWACMLRALSTVGG